MKIQYHQHISCTGTITLIGDATLEDVASNMDCGRFQRRQGGLINVFGPDDAIIAEIVPDDHDQYEADVVDIGDIELLDGPTITMAMLRPSIN
jgi:hypothetical protein